LKLTRSRHPQGKDGLEKLQTDYLEEDSDEDISNKDNERDGVKAEIVAVADKTYAFSAPADFQYVGQDRRPFEVQWVARPDRVEDDPEFLPKQPLLCTPSMFAVEPAIDYAFKQYKAAEHGLDLLGRKPKRGMGITWVDYFAPEVPSADTKTLGSGSGAAHGGGGGDTNTAAPNGRGGGGGGGGVGQGQRALLAPTIEALVSRLEMVFNGRPVYLESALAAALGSIEVGGGGGGVAGASTSSASSSTFTSFPATRSQQELLSKLCYRFKNGPWKGTWVLRGYDPRAEPAARQYQVLEYSLPVEWWKKVLTHKNKVAKQLQQLQLHSSSRNTTTTAAVSTMTTLDGNEVSTAPGLPPVAPSYTALCSFSGVQSTQTLQLQLCDIDDSEIRSVLAETSNVASGVGDGSGWLTQAAWEGIKTKVAARFGALWEAAAAQAANMSDSTPVGAAGSGHADSGTGIGIIPSGLMSELVTYLERGQISKLPVATATAADGGRKRQGGTGEEAAGSAGDGTAVALARSIVVEADEDEDDDDDEEDEVEIEEDEDDDEEDDDA
jgi:general transcription factor 3C polypeptide 5 (transcription factor C subunit 1)